MVTFSLFDLSVISAMLFRSYFQAMQNTAYSFFLSSLFFHLSFSCIFGHTLVYRESVTDIFPAYLGIKKV